MRLDIFSKLDLWVISRLPIYASLSSIFVVVAPRATHSDTGLTCDKDTYQHRLWCRVRLFSHYFRRGRNAMYLLQKDSTLASVDRSWLLDALFVFEGDCTCCLRKHEGMKCDKLNIFEDLIVQSERRCVQETYIFGSSFSDVQSEGECLSMLFCPIVIPRIRARLRPTVHEAAAPYSLGSLAGYATIGVSRMGVQWL